jgi:hypothetical protein
MCSNVLLVARESLMLGIVVALRVELVTMKREFDQYYYNRIRLGVK